MRAAGRESRFERLPNPRDLGYASFDEKHEVHQVFRSRVEPSLPGEGIGVDLLGELLGLWDGEHSGRSEAGELEDLISDKFLRLAEAWVPDADIEMEPRVALPEDSSLARESAATPGCLGQFRLHLADSVLEEIAEVDARRGLESIE